MHLNRIWAITAQQNIPAIKLIEKLGFVKIANLEDNEVEYDFRMN